MSVKFTVHTIVKNEENFIKYSLLSVLEFAERLLVWDTGSTDKTIEIIKSLKSPKIEFREFGSLNRDELVELRNEQIKQTKTSWFLILDGDEIWPRSNLLRLIKAMEKARGKTVGLVNKTRNCTGDIYHYLPQQKGKYQIGPWLGHLNVRAIKKIPGLKVEGKYPLEAYTLSGISIQNLPERLEFVDTWYLHVTHLKRSRWPHQLKTLDRIKKYKFLGKARGIKMKREELPEVLVG